MFQPEYLFFMPLNISNVHLYSNLTPSIIYATESMETLKDLDGVNKVETQLQTLGK